MAVQTSSVKFVSLAAAVVLLAGVLPARSAGARAPDPGNAAYRVEGRAIALHGGQADVPEGLRTRLVGVPAFGDLDGDGAEDAAVFLAQEAGGSGTFCYVAAVFGGDAGGGTEAVPLGDRVAPKSLAIRDGRVFVEYADRRPGDPMTAPASVERRLVLAAGDRTLRALAPEAAAPGEFPAQALGLEWRLLRLVWEGTEHTVAADAVPTLSLEASGKAQGLATLNRYSGTARYEGEGRVRWEGPFGATRMAGPEPLMEQERVFLSALEATRRGALRGGRLVLESDDGRAVLEFGR